MSAAGLIVLILALIGLGVGIYYAFLCFRLKPKSTNIDPEQGPLMRHDPDVNGNHEETSPSEGANDIVSSVSAVDEPDRSVPLVSEDAEPSSDLMVATVAPDLHDKHVNHHKGGSKQPKVENLRTIEEEPNSPCLSMNGRQSEPKPSNLNSSDVPPDANLISTVKYISDTDAEDGLQQSRPRLNDSLEETTDLKTQQLPPQPESQNQTSHDIKSVQYSTDLKNPQHKPAIETPHNLNTPETRYGWHTNVSDNENIPVDESNSNEINTSIKKQEESLEKNDPKIIIPSKITVMPSVSCNPVPKTEFTSTHDEPSVTLDDVSVTKPFYQPVVARATVTHATSSHDDILSDMSVDTLPEDALYLQYPTRVVTDIDKFSDVQENQLQKDKDTIPKVVPNGQNNISQNENKTLDQHVTNEKVKSLTSLSTDSLSQEDNNAHSESDTSDPEITEYNFTSEQDDRVNSAMAGELQSSNDVKITNFVPITNYAGTVEDNPVVHRELKTEGESVRVVPNLSDELSDVIIPNEYLILSNHGNMEVPSNAAKGDSKSSSSDVTSSDSDTSSSSCDEQLERAMSEEIIINNYKQVVKSNKIKSREPYVISNAEAFANQNQQTVAAQSPTYEPMPTFLVVDSTKDTVALKNEANKATVSSSSQPSDITNSHSNDESAYSDSNVSSKIPRAVKNHRKE